MKRSRYDGSDLRRVVAGVCRNPAVCSAIAARWPAMGGLFGSPAVDLLVGLVVEHYRKYGDVPNGQLGGLLADHAERNNLTEEEISGAERLLSAVADEPEGDVTTDYILDLATRAAGKAKARRLRDEAEQSLDSGDVEDFYSRLSDFAPVDLRPRPGMHLAVDYESWGLLLNPDRRKPLIVLKDSLGAFFGDVLQRGKLFSFMGPDKSGKSFWLLELAFQALRQQLRVAYFEVGDLGEEDMLLRLGTRASRRPEVPGVVKFPIGWEEREDGTWPKFEERVHDEPFSVGDAYKALNKVCRGQDRIILSCHSSDSINAVGVSAVVDGWLPWKPDVIVVDYADILAPPPGKFGEKHEQIDQTWKHLRRLSQELDCLVLTATQSSALAYGDGEGVLGPRHFSGGKTKLAHVNGMVGINASFAEREWGVTRLNWVVRRRGRHSPRRVVRVAGCLDYSCPAVIFQ